MRRLGYGRYVSQGGDWGALVTDVMGRQAPKGLLGIHVTTLLGRDRTATNAEHANDRASRGRESAQER